MEAFFLVSGEYCSYFGYVMRVYDSNIIGKWKHRDEDRIYRFFKHGVVGVQSKDRIKAFRYSIVTKKEFSSLVIDGKTFPFVVMANNHFSIMSSTFKFISYDRIE
jgi:hypothetical protein